MPRENVIFRCRFPIRCRGNSTTHHTSPICWQMGLLTSTSARISPSRFGEIRLSGPQLGGTCLSGPMRANWIIHCASASVTGTPLRFCLSEGRARRVRCPTLDYPSRFDGHAPCMFKIAESMLKLVLVGWADPRRERSDRSGAARPVVRSSAPRSPETVSELDPGRFYGCNPNSYQGFCLRHARIDKEG